MPVVSLTIFMFHPFFLLISCFRLLSCTTSHVIAHAVSLGFYLESLFYFFHTFVQNISFIFNLRCNKSYIFDTVILLTFIIVFAAGFCTRHFRPHYWLTSVLNENLYFIFFSILGRSVIFMYRLWLSLVCHLFLTYFFHFVTGSPSLKNGERFQLFFTQFSITQRCGNAVLGS